MQSNQAPKAIQAREGFYFLDNDSNKVVEQITGRKRLTQKEIFNWRMVLETRHCWFAKHDIPYFYLVVPNKHCLYSEHLPNNIRLAPDRPITQILQAIEDSFVSFMYPLDELISCKDRGLLYRLKDSHWTQLGAYHCYSALGQQILASGVPLHKVEPDEIIFSEQPAKHSDLGIHFNDSEDTDIKATMPDSDIKRVLANGVLNTGNLQVWKNHQGDGLPRAVIFRDSFCNQMTTFWAASFSETVFVWQPNIDFEIIRDFQPDVVISQQVERFITTVPQDLFAPTLLERQQAKVELKQIKQTAPFLKALTDIGQNDQTLSEPSSVFVQKYSTELLLTLATRFPNALAVQANYILNLIRLDKATEAERHYVLLINRKQDIPLKFHQMIESHLNSR